MRRYGLALAILAGLALLALVAYQAGRGRAERSDASRGAGEEPGSVESREGDGASPGSRTNDARPPGGDETEDAARVSLRVIVTDPSGLPIPRAQVNVRGARGSFVGFPAEATTALRAVTNEGGEARFSVSAAELFLVTASAEARESASRDAVWPGSTVRLRLAARPLPNVLLFAVDDTGTRIAPPLRYRASLLAEDKPERLLASGESPVQPVGVSVPIAFAGAVRVRVGAEGYHYAVWTGPAPGTDRVTETVEVTPAPVLAGVVTDAETGAPVHDAVCRTGGYFPSRTRTDPAGRFRLACTIARQESGRYGLWVDHPAYERQSRTVPLEEAGDIAIRLVAAKGVRLRLVDAETSKPVPNGAVRIGRQAGASVSSFETFRVAGPEGALVTRLHAGAVYRAVVSAPGYADSYVGLGVEQKPDNSALVVRMRPAIRVTVRLKDRAGEPLVGRRVRIELVEGQIQVFGSDAGKQARIMWTGGPVCVSDRDGRISFVGGEGTARLSLLAAGGKEQGRMWMSLGGRRPRFDIEVGEDAFQ